MFIMRGLGVLCFIFAGLVSGEESRAAPEVETEQGIVRGEILETVVNSVRYSSFKGIPYAEPPLNHLRFKPPVSKKPWDNIWNATEDRNHCVQRDFIYVSEFTGDEDCLYLNVYSPKLEFKNTEEDLIPVMVWIHGGSFKGGYKDSPLYGPDLLIQEGVVLVTLNYRLGPLGFLNLKLDDATGNAGLKDQTMVLRWVKQNIAKFGGDPDSVTLFGQSAGGVSVDLHSLSEMSKGLFHRSIAMSASPLCPWGFHTADEAVKRAFTLGKILGSKTEDTDELLKFLRGKSALEIMKATDKMGGADPPFKPSIESTELAKDEQKFLTECLYWKYFTGNFNRLPHLTGYTAAETVLFAGSIESFHDTVNFAYDSINSIPNLPLASLPGVTALSSFIANRTVDISQLAESGLIGATTDLLFVLGIDKKRKLVQGENNEPVYYYRFSYDTEESMHRQIYNISLKGTAHGDDLPYLFHMKVGNFSLNKSDSTFITRERMVRLWTNFAKFGNPTPKGRNESLLQDITWPDSASSNQYLEFGESLVIKTDPTDAMVKIIESLNSGVLAIRTGCVGDVVSQISRSFRNPLKSNIAENIKERVKVVTSKMGSAIKEGVKPLEKIFSRG